MPTLAVSAIQALGIWVVVLGWFLHVVFFIVAAVGVLVCAGALLELDHRYACSGDEAEPGDVPELLPATPTVLAREGTPSVAVSSAEAGDEGVETPVHLVHGYLPSVEPSQLATGTQDGAISAVA